MKILLEVTTDQAEPETLKRFVETFCRMVNDYTGQGKVVPISLSQDTPALELIGAWPYPACMCCVDNECECHGTDLA